MGLSWHPYLGVFARVGGQVVKRSVAPCLFDADIGELIGVNHASPSHVLISNEAKLSRDSRVADELDSDPAVAQPPRQGNRLSTKRSTDADTDHPVDR